MPLMCYTPAVLECLPTLEDAILFISSTSIVVYLERYPIVFLESKNQSIETIYRPNLSNETIKIRPLTNAVSILMPSIDTIVPIIRRVLNPISIPIPPRHTMYLFLCTPASLPHRGPIAILHRTPSPTVRDVVLSCSEIIFLLSATPGPGERAPTRVRVMRIFGPS